jgi:hypothetical protein
MKYKPRHPVLNFISAILIFSFGIVCLIYGFSHIGRSDFHWDAWGVHTGFSYGLFFGVLWTTLGAVGIYYFGKYFKAQHKKDEFNPPKHNSPKSPPRKNF